jgi:invasion protein IalB
VTLQVDQRPPTPLAFRTCLPIGCIVSIAFSPADVATLRSAAVLTVTATADNALEMPFRISLKGFGSAVDRTAALSK